MNDKKARTLPVCEECKAAYEQLHGRPYGTSKPKKSKRGIEPPARPVAVAVEPGKPVGSWANQPWLWDQGLTLSRVPKA